ncbi:MAG: HlyD family efflux transporter periplasmic adaptor subunit [Cyclobacteriaceae bacterium]
MRILIPVILVFIAACQSGKEGINPEKRDITESVYASLTVQPDSLYNAYAVVSGIVEKVMVSEGSPVKINDPLVRILNEAPELNLKNARLDMDQAKADLSGENNALSDLKNQITTARLQKEDDSINYQRQERLWEQNIGSRTEFERKRLAYELSKNRLDNLQTAYEKLRRDLEVRYRQAQNNFEVAQLNTSDYTVRSKINGKVYSVEKEIGEKVALQEPVAVLGSADRFILEMLIDERDIAKVSVGQEILLTLEAYGDQVFTAKIFRIYPQKNERNQTFLAEGEFTGDVPAQLYAGLSGEANILIRRKKDALSIPLDYLTPDSEVITDEGKVPVETGIRSLDRVEILDGISEETIIYLPQ